MLLAPRRGLSSSAGPDNGLNRPIARRVQRYTRVLTMFEKERASRCIQTRAGGRKGTRDARGHASGKRRRFVISDATSRGKKP